MELINQKHLDPAFLFEVPEMVAELQRWRVQFPQQQPQESDQLYREHLKKVYNWLLSVINLWLSAIYLKRLYDHMLTQPEVLLYCVLCSIAVCLSNI